MVTTLPSAATNTSCDRREAQRLATREKLLAISVDEFRRVGFARTDVATIVERAGVSRGTFYFHFPTKDDVLSELRMREELRIVEEVGPYLEANEPLGSILGAVVDGILDAEGRLGPGLVRDICAVQFRPSIVATDSLDAHPVAELVLRAVVATRPTRSPGVAQRLSDLAIIFLVGMFGLLATQNGPSADRDRLIDRLIALTVKGVSKP